jgi:hypothetical protein
MLICPKITTKSGRGRLGHRLGSGGLDVLKRKESEKEDFTENAEGRGKILH